MLLRLNTDSSSVTTKTVDTVFENVKAVLIICIYDSQRPKEMQLILESSIQILESLIKITKNKVYEMSEKREETRTSAILTTRYQIVYKYGVHYI